MSTAVVKNKGLYYFHFIVVALLIFGFKYLPAPAPITETGMALLGVFLGAIYGWSTINIIWPSVLAILGMGMALGMPAVLSAGFGSNITWMIVFTYIAMGLLEENHILDVASAYLLTRKFFQGKPWIFYGFIIFAAFLCGMIGGFASIILFLTLVFKISQKVGFEPYGKFVTAASLGILLVHLFDMIIFPFLGNSLIFISIWTPMSGTTIDYGRYMLCSITLSIIGIIVYLLVCRFVLRLDLTPLKDFKIEELGFETMKLNTKQKLAILVTAWIFVNLLIPSILPKTWGIVIFLQSITTFGQVLIPVVVFMAISYQGQPIIDFRKLSPYISWEVIMITGTILPLAMNLTSEGTGISPFMVGLIQPLIGLGLNSFVFLFIIMFIAAIVTNFANNTVVAVILMPVILTIAKIDPSLSSTAGFFIMVFMSHLALLTPSACPFAAIMYGNSQWINIKSAMKYGIPIFLCLYLALFSIGYLLAAAIL